MKRSFKFLQGVLKSFDELKGFGTVQLSQSQQEFRFTSRELRDEVNPGDSVIFEVQTINGGRLTARNIMKSLKP